MIAERFIQAHRFKIHEWLYIKTKSELIDLLREYKRDFLHEEIVWDERIIRHFLELFHYLYPKEYPEIHHIRCIYTILSEVDL